MPPDSAVNFQFTGQRFFRLDNGRLTGQLRDVAYQATTTEARPGQVAAVSHGCPSALFKGVNILNTTQEAGR